MGRAIEMDSPLAPEECAARLSAAIDPGDRGWGVPGVRPVIGRVTGRSVWLRKRIQYRNGFQTILTGTLEECAAGSRFRGRAGMHRSTRVFVSFWMGSMSLLGVRTCVAFLLGGGNPGGLLMAPLFLGLGGGIIWLGCWLAREEERFLTEFAADVMAARSAASAGPGGAGPNGDRSPEGSSLPAVGRAVVAERRPDGG